MALTKEQLEQRRKGIGGSDISGVMGLSRWKTPLSVWVSKVYPDPIEEAVIGSKNEPAYWGNKLEDVVAATFTEVTGKKVYRVNETLVHPDYSFLRANIDRRVVGEDALLEVKTATLWKAKEWEGEEIPIEYILQVQHYLAVTGKQKGYIACLIGGQRFVWKEIERDEDTIKKMIEIAIDFWTNFVEKKISPAPTGEDCDNAMLKQLYPQASPQTFIDLPADYERLIENREKLKSEIEEKEKFLFMIENKIRSKLQANEAGKVGQYIVSWKNQERKNVDSKKLKELFPQVYSDCQRVNNIRVLRIKKLKGGEEQCQ